MLMGDGNDIWSTTRNRTEERKLIHQFWLELSKEERKSLILIEKEAVLRKIKDQQKNNCNCSICGKTRFHVEYELEILYDAYFKELEKYAYGQKQKQLEKEEEEEEDDYEQDEDDTDEEDDNDNFELPARTVKQDIFTVSDNNVKRDGEKLLSMMHKFAEKKRLREEEALEDSTSEEEEEEDGEDEDSDHEFKSEAQKRQDALKMFTVFAARMFEQRVLAAYREKVAQDRQKKLIEELEEEDRKKQERELKKQKEKEEKKNKKRLLKLQQEKEREEELDRKRQAEIDAKLKQEEERQLREQERLKKEQERQRKEIERMQKETEKRKKRLKEKEIERKRKEEEKRKKKEQQQQQKQQQQQQQQAATNENEPQNIILSRQLPVAGPIGSPVDTTHNKPLSNQGQNQRSFFSSSHLFDQPTNKRFAESTTINEHSPKRQSNLKWTNGWTQLNALSNNVHGKLFVDVITSRYPMIIQRTRVAYKKLDEESQVFLPKPFFHSLSQLHRSIHETYNDDIVISMREMYEAITRYPEHEFKCILSEHQGYVVYNDPTKTVLYPF